MDDGAWGSYRVIYDGSSQPNVYKFSIGGLTTGTSYWFKLQSLNINGYSVDSLVETISACLKPTGLNAPFKIETTISSIKLGWTEPNDNGCPITTYAIFRDTGVGDLIDEPVDPSDVENKPSLREHTTSTGLITQGATYWFKIWAYNDAGYVDSDPLSVILASVPVKPTNGPYSDASITDETKLMVLFDPIPPLNTGGSNIVSYEL